ncbi:WXG100 family type VII secretion target [Frankia sp. AgPm24]|uniref:WXG100 family type VII secretion target n=1 Tax=Frankia sp. AgPm24 TaxID=631128 RepID=UPI00200E5361|nr:WXG100 family type VII secretion target [Frankia sp. AgPm24]MCK9924277.1 WXG100 family type VII secretion target [Frankia sp. AgPm24]
MADIDVDYAQVNALATRLINEGTEITSTLTRLQFQVTELLTSAGGLWMQQSSPAMTTQYTEFNASLTSAIENIPKFADSFKAISANLQTMDDSLANPPADT